MLQYQIGPLSLRHRPMSAERVDRLNSIDLAVKPVMGVRQPGEYVGPGEDVLTLGGTLFPHHQGGKTEIEIAHLLVNGFPVFVLRGDLRPMGWFQVVSVSERGTFPAADGVGKRVEVTITMRKSPRPTIAGLIATLINMFS